MRSARSSSGVCTNVPLAITCFKIASLRTQAAHAFSAKLIPCDDSFLLRHAVATVELRLDADPLCEGEQVATTPDASQRGHLRWTC
jgi:hypothetical protein